MLHKKRKKHRGKMSSNSAAETTADLIETKPCESLIWHLQPPLCPAHCCGSQQWRPQVGTPEVQSPAAPQAPLSEVCRPQKPGLRPGALSDQWYVRGLHHPWPAGCCSLGEGGLAEKSQVQTGSR